ncbi:MAG: hemerythrin family protein [Polyangiaceae bacterium]
MTNVLWKDEYVTHDSVVDAEHRSMFKMLNELQRLIASGVSDAKLGDILGHLVDYAARHFAAEETLMVSTGYPSCDEHRAKHLLLLAKGRQLVEMHGDGSLRLGPDLPLYLESWFSTHILEDDKPMVQWVRLQGGTIAASGHWRIHDESEWQGSRLGKKSGRS